VGAASRDEGHEGERQRRERLLRWSPHAGWFWTPRNMGRENRRCLSAADGVFPPLLILDPIVARLFKEKGVDSRRKLIDWSAQNARLPAREYWDEQWVQTLLLPLAHAGVEPYASRLKAKPDEIVSMFEAKDINVVVVGGETQGAWKILGVRHQATVSVDAWR
jgi:hypothetical protein